MFQDENKKVIQDWETNFPNKCIVCSYHRYGYEHGMTADEQPPKHECKYTHKKETQKRT